MDMGSESRLMGHFEEQGREGACSGRTSPVTGEATLAELKPNTRRENPPTLLISISGSSVMWYCARIPADSDLAEMPYFDKNVRHKRVSYFGLLIEADGFVRICRAMLRVDRYRLFCW